MRSVAGEECPMLKKVLVANRAEIAQRVIRACRDLGVPCVAVYSEADRKLRYVDEADEAIEIGPASALESYLSIEKVIDAAKQVGADSIHPGYGFLAENPGLARATRDAGLVFIGPPADVIEALGSKLNTRRIMIEAGVPVLPGTEALEDPAEVASAAAEIGYPVLIKPSGGGGGRGMRVVEGPEELERSLEASKREAERSFKDSSVYVEKFLGAARHVEVQVLADTHGNVIHVGDRDCSMQRRHQKVIEESPAPGLSDEQHEHVRSLAVRAARAAGYHNAGTVEFLFDGADDFYLLEVNTRIQVEHCATEATSGIDLVTEQIRIASGERLSIRQEDVVLRGTAIECRIYAEDPSRSFAPSVGRITAARFPSGPWVREDRGFEPGDQITPYYDGMMGKLIVWGPTRDIAIARTLRALGEYRFAGIRTNVSLLRWLVDSSAFRELAFDTKFMEREVRAELLPPDPPFEVPEEPVVEAAASVAAPAAAEAAPRAAAAMHARKVDLYLYQRTTPGVEFDYLIHVVPGPDGGVQAIPLAPGDRRWADPPDRRSGSTADEAVAALVSEVLEQKMPDEIFPEIAVSY
jgi:acetyl-CoA carboxylase biotin carboxylase subunit